MWYVDGLSGVIGTDTYTVTVGSKPVTVICKTTANGQTSYESNGLTIYHRAWKPSISADKTTAKEGDRVDFSVRQPVPGVKYEWYVTEIENTSTFGFPFTPLDPPGPIPPIIPLDPIPYFPPYDMPHDTHSITLGAKSIKVYCEAWYKGFPYAVSNTVTITNTSATGGGWNWGDLVGTGHIGDDPGEGITRPPTFWP
jgi:hypothetical protein